MLLIHTFIYLCLLPSNALLTSHNLVLYSWFLHARYDKRREKNIWNILRLCGETLPFWILVDVSSSIAAKDIDIGGGGGLPDSFLCFLSQMWWSQVNEPCRLGLGGGSYLSAAVFYKKTIRNKCCCQRLCRPAVSLSSYKPPQNVELVPVTFHSTAVVRFQRGHQCGKKWSDERH